PRYPLPAQREFWLGLLVLRLHSDRGGDFSSDLLRAFYRAEGFRQTFTLPASPQQNGIAERRIGMVMDVGRTSMIHAAAPHFLWSFAVQNAAHQINLQPRVSLAETTPTLRWTGKVCDASVFRVWGSRAFVSDTSADKLSSRAIPCVFLGFPPDALGWKFYHPTSRHVLSSQDVSFDQSVSYYRLFPYRTASLPPPATLPSTRYSSAIDSGAAGSAEPGVAMSEGAESGGAEPGGAAPERAESGGSPGVLSRREPLSPQGLREWYARRCSRAAGATGHAVGGASGAGAAGGAASAAAIGGASGAAGGAAGAGAAGAAGPGGAGAGGTGAVGGPAGVAGGAGAAGPGDARTGGTGAAGAGGTAGVGAVGAGALATGGAARAGAAGGTRAGVTTGVVAGDPRAEGTGAVSAVSGGTARPRPYYVPLLQQPASPLPGPSPYSGPTRGLTERRKPESHPASPESHPASLESRPESPDRAVRTGRRVPHQRPPPVPGTHSMTLHPSTTPLCVPLPSPPASSLPDGPDPESDSLHAASPTVTRLLATAVTDPSFEPTSASALVTELVDFAASCCLHYATSLVAEFESACVCPPSVRVMDAEMASWKSTGTYVDDVPPPGANIGVDFFQTFSPTPKMTTLRVLLHVAAQRDYELHSLDFSTAFVQGSLHEEIWLRRPPGFTGLFPSGTQWSLRRPFYGLRQAPREWHDTLRTTLAALGFAPSTADPSLFLCTDTTLPPFYVLVYVDDLVFATADTEAPTHVKSKLQKRHTCTDLGELVLQRFGLTYSSPQSTPLPTGHSPSAPPSDESVESSGPYPELVGCLMYLMTCTRPDLAYPLSVRVRRLMPAMLACLFFIMLFLAQDLCACMNCLLS
ncbi:unnamed protein product, partial [Closterium sp. NIES-54]